MVNPAFALATAFPEVTWVHEFAAIVYYWNVTEGVTLFGWIVLAVIGLLVLLGLYRWWFEKTPSGNEWNYDARIWFPALARLLALGVDLLFFAVPVWYLGQFLSPIRFESPNLGPLHGSLNFGFGSPTSPWGWEILLFVIPLPYTLFEALFGATPGKFFCSLRVVNLAGRKPSFAAICIRNLLRPLDMGGYMFLGGITMLFSKYNQRIGDHAAGTYVVDPDAVLWIHQHRHDWRWAWGIAVGIFVAAYVSLLTAAYLSPPSLAIDHSTGANPFSWTVLD